MSNPKTISAKSLKIRKTPMPRNVIKKSRVGKKFGKPFTHFLASLFKINETLSRSNKMTDGEIARQIKEEFDHIPEIKNKFSNRNPDLTYMMSKYRSEYNRGRLVPSKAPPEDKYVSFCYNDDGDAVNPRFITPKILTEEEKTKIRAKFERHRQAFRKDRNLNDED
jgi:hypothetical protein